MSVSWRWKLVYADGSTFTDLDGAPHESPVTGVLFLCQPASEPPILLNADWFMYREDHDEWTQCGSDGMVDHAVLYGHLISAFRKTLWVRSPDFKALWAQAREELGI